MRLARYGLAASAAVLLVGAAAATVVAGRTVETTGTVSTVHVDIAPLDTPSATVSAFQMDTIVGSDGERRLTIAGSLPGSPGASVSFRGAPDVTTLTVDPSLDGALLVLAFAGVDGSAHVLRAEVRATAPVETWTNGPFAAPIDGAMAALQTCESHAVPADAFVTLDGVPIGMTGSSTIADIVIRDCSTVALYR
jgi:hypothetical protein